MIFFIFSLPVNRTARAVDQFFRVAVHHIRDFFARASERFARPLEGEQFLIDEERYLVGLLGADLAQMSVLRRVAVKTRRYEIYIRSVFLYPARPHPEDRHVRSVHHVLGSRVSDDLGYRVLAAVRRKIVHEIRRAVKVIRERVSDVLFDVCAPDMGDYQPYVREKRFYLEYLFKVDGIPEPPVARDVEHHDRAELVHSLQLFLREKVEDADLFFGYVRGREIEIRFQAEEAAAPDHPLDFVRALSRVTVVKSGPARFSRRFGDVVVVRRAAFYIPDLVREHQGGYVLVREQKTYIQILLKLQNNLLAMIIIFQKWI